MNIMNQNPFISHLIGLPTLLFPSGMLQNAAEIRNIVFFNYVH